MADMDRTVRLGDEERKDSMGEHTKADAVAGTGGGLPAGWTWQPAAAAAAWLAHGGDGRAMMTLQARSREEVEARAWALHLAATAGEDAVGRVREVIERVDGLPYMARARDHDTSESLSRADAEAERQNEAYVRALVAAARGCSAIGQGEANPRDTHLSEAEVARDAIEQTRRTGDRCFIDNLKPDELREGLRLLIRAPTGDRKRLVERICLALADFDEEAHAPATVVEMHRAAAEHIAGYVVETPPSSGDREREALNNALRRAGARLSARPGATVDYRLALADMEVETLRELADASPSPTGGEGDDARPRHGDVWKLQSSVDGRFSVMHVCGHGSEPHVTGYWWSDGNLDPARHGSIPLARFVENFVLVERVPAPASSAREGSDDGDR